MISVLITGGGAPGAAGIIRCLKKDKSINLFACDANSEAVGRYLVDNFFTIPKADDPDFTDKLLEACIKNDIRLVLPLVTRELIPLSKAKKKFSENGIEVLVSEENALEIANDKGQLYRFLFENKIPVPDFRIANTFSEFEKAVTDLGYPGKKVCFKPTVSNGSRGFRILDDKVNEFDLLFNHKPNSTYMSYADCSRILGSQKFPPLLVSEFLPGEEYSVDCLVNNGKCILAVPRLRSKMNNGISVAGEFIKDDSIISYATAIVEKIGLHGNIGVQVKRSDTGKFLILEINPRVQGTIVSALGAGVNLPLLAVKQATSMSISEIELKVKWGTKFSRFWDEVYY